MISFKLQIHVDLAIKLLDVNLTKAGGTFCTRFVGLKVVPFSRRVPVKGLTSSQKQLAERFRWRVTQHLER